jgi:glycosyltransferase involved in cell wall biosynthesis
MERAMMETVDGLLDRGWSVTVIARVCETPTRPGLRWVKIRTLRRPFVAAFPLFALVAGLLLARSRRTGELVVTLGAIVPNRVDAITVQFCHAGFAEHRIRRSSRSSLLGRINGALAKPLALGLERWCYRPERVRRMTAVSELIRDELRMHYPLESVPIDVIGNGVDAQRFRPDPAARQQHRQRLGLAADALVAIFVGGDWHRKGLRIAVEAAGIADWTLIVVGKGDAAEWASLASEHSADVRFCGHVSDPESLLCTADAFLLPSSYEGFALVTIEAAAAGLPLLVTKATGAGPLVEQSGGRVLPPRAEDFAAELSLLAADHELRAERGQRARKAAEHQTWAEIVPRYSYAYSLASPPSPGAASSIAALTASRSPADTTGQSKHRS